MWAAAALAQAQAGVAGEEVLVVKEVMVKAQAVAAQAVKAA